MVAVCKDHAGGTIEGFNSTAGKLPMILFGKKESGGGQQAGDRRRNPVDGVGGIVCTAGGE